MNQLHTPQSNCGSGVDTEVDAVDTPPPPPVPVASGFRDYAMQQRWENYQRDMGVWRYRQSTTREVQRGSAQGARVARDWKDVEPGQRIAGEVIKPLAERLAVVQKDYLEEIANPKLARLSVVHAVFQILSPEVLAVTTVLAALSRAEPAQFQGCCLDLGGKVMREVELLDWKKREADAEKERTDQGLPWQVNMYKLMRQRNDGKVDERVFQKWRRKAEQYIGREWDSNERKVLGANLYLLMIDCSGYFEVKETMERGKTKLMFGLTDPALAWMQRRHAQNELARPFMLPMICEPRDYEYLPERKVEEELCSADD